MSLRKDILLKVGILVAQRELSLRQDNWWEAAGARSLVRTKNLAHQHSQWPVATPQQLFARAKNSRAWDARQAAFCCCASFRSCHPGEGNCRGATIFCE
jgi:hypothetical protein